MIMMYTYNNLDITLCIMFNNHDTQCNMYNHDKCIAHDVH